jgi:uncharacterized protein
MMEERKMRTGIIGRRSMRFLVVLAVIVGGLITIPISPFAFAESQFLEEMVLMRDGVRLHTFVYLPDNKVWNPPYPVIIQRTPYGIGKVGTLPGLNQPVATLRGWKAGIERGYAIVFQDTRGRFASEGIFRLFYDDASDGYDTIEWVASQPWCNGKVGVAGSSAAGIVTYASASERPPHLKALFSQGAASNLFNDIFYEGQSFELEFRLLSTVTPVDLSPSHIKSLKFSDNELKEVITLNQAITNDLKSHMFNSAKSKWWMHLPLLNYPAISQLLPFQNELLSHPTQDGFRDHLNFRDRMQVPAIHVTTWYDFAAESNLETFKVLQERVGNQKLFIGPGDHFAVYSPTFLPYDPFFQWFDFWLKGIDTNIMDGPPVYYYHMGTEKWRYADQWPLPSVENKKYYLHSDGILNTNAPSGQEPSIGYTYDPNNPVQTLGGRNLLLPKGPRDQRPVEPPNRKDILVYKSEVLSKDVEIAGTVRIILHAASTCKDTDFHAKLIDVHPDGKTMLVLDGVIRALYRDSPKIPVPMEPGKVYEFTIALGDINHVFKAGNRIQVDISSSNFPRRARNTNSGNLLFSADTEKDIVVATNTIYHGSQYLSYLMLPVLPPQKPNLFEGTANIQTTGVTYKGPAELYVFPTAVYAHFKDRWIKWKTIKNWKEGSEERYESEGKVGKLSVVLQPKDLGPFDIIVTGEGIYFKGWQK